jgi:hypothetical protein
MKMRKELNDISGDDIFWSLDDFNKLEVKMKRDKVLNDYEDFVYNVNEDEDFDKIIERKKLEVYQQSLSFRVGLKLIDLTKGKITNTELRELTNEYKNDVENGFDVYGLYSNFDYIMGLLKLNDNHIKMVRKRFYKINDTMRMICVYYRLSTFIYWLYEILKEENETDLDSIKNEDTLDIINGLFNVKMFNISYLKKINEGTIK